MIIIQQIAFIIISAIAIFLFYKKVMEIRRNILIGKDEDLTDQPKNRWQNLIMNALGQKKMFSNPLVAVLHLFVYVGFIIINIEIVEIILDGITGHHRIFAQFFGGFYNFLIGCFEILAFLVLVACVIFAFRRNVTKVNRLNKGELLEAQPRNDANLILIFEIVLMSLFLIMNAVDLNLQALGAAHFTIYCAYI
jgi:hypothetical protein